MVLSSIDVLLVNRDGGVDNVWFDSLLVDYWLHCLVHMVMYVLAGNLGCSGFVGLICPDTNGLMLELGLLLLEMLLRLLMITVIMFAVFYADLFVMVLFWENFLVLDRLDSCVVMILVDFTIFYDLCFFTLMLLDGLLLNVWCDRLVDSCVIVT